MKVSAVVVELVPASEQDNDQHGKTLAFDCASASWRTSTGSMWPREMRLCLAIQAAIKEYEGQ